MKIITKDKARKLIDKGAIIVDMRSPILFRDSHIDGSINLPLKKFTNLLITTVEKNKPIIVYGTTINDDDIVYGIKYSEQLGFTNIHAIDYFTLK